MAPPRSTPRLADLVPTDVARDAVARALTHVQRVAWLIDPGATLTSPRATEYSALGLTVAALTTYAQRGGPVWDWQGAGEAIDAIQTVLSVLWSSASDTTSAGPLADHEGDLDDDDPVAVVLLAAWARATLEGGGSVTLRELGALAGLAAPSMRRLADAGELAVTDERPARVRAAEARRWLGAREVAGYA